MRPAGGRPRAGAARHRGHPALHAAHGGRPATGPEEIKALQDAPGQDFGTKFLNLLIAHQHNAVELAQ
ncbi:DUF305 domain-containing protein [Dactylosporangium darangshiense]|uniref:DUF305 domain-containing protein n=1 Tax=Dactylosporangium darangshiense TaxID=579108 RepID=A0ABP8DHL1_9ACTN